MKEESDKMLKALSTKLAPRKRILLLAVTGTCILLLYWAISVPLFRDDEGFLNGLVCFPISVGVALLILSWGLITERRVFAGWLALALVGQAAALQMIVAGSDLRYQHYRPLVASPLFLLLVGVQAVLVWWGLRVHLGTIWAWLRRRWRLWQLFLVALFFSLTSATVSEPILYFFFELPFAALLQFINLGNMILVGLSIPKNDLVKMCHWLERILEADGAEGDLRLDRFAAGAAVWVIVLAALLNLFSYEQHPHVPDEFAYIYHARYLAAGKLATTAPPSPESFDVYLMQFSGDRWYPSPPPGWPAFLAQGERFGVGWLVNPLLGGFNLLLAYLLLQHLYTRRLARLSVFLLAVSPWYIFLAMSYMTHMATFFCALLATMGVAWTRSTGKIVWAWLGGIALGMLALIRPLEAASVAGLLGLWAIGVGGKRIKLAGTVGLVLMSMIVGGTNLIYNQALTGDPTQFPIMAYTDERFGPNANALGFGPDRGMGWALDPFPGHSPRDALINADLNAFAINIEMTGWSIGSLLFAAVFVLSGKLQRSDYLMLAMIAVIFTVHFFYYFGGGPDFGARYWFLMILPIAVLTARGIDRVAGYLDDLNGVAGTRVLVMVLALSLLALVNFFPWRAIDKYHHFRGMRPDVRYLAEEYDFGRSLVFVRGDSHPDYASAAVYNPIDMYADNTLYVWDRRPELRTEVVEEYEDRPIWVLNGPTVTGNGFEVVAGPLTPAEFLQGAAGE